ncbi:PREDICTED: uncharacterized protein LOC109185873 [Ipomoea nil]|uniref:uncharacterized protein LOC109185873 n=1 Tax=Ipomoea nil TaxID=35883 RepID=UPI000901EE1A|nr:PREDICTED: uncharacterized protein LOC109185873 [Ipomoea nil]
MNKKNNQTIRNQRDSPSFSMTLSFSVVLYFVWKARNAVLWDACLPLLKKTWSMACSSLLAWRQVHVRQASSSATPAAHHVIAQPSCFFDAGYCPATGDATYGAVLLAASRRRAVDV